MDRVIFLSGMILVTASTYADASSSEYTVSKSVYIELCRSKTITGPLCQTLLAAATPKLPAPSAPNPASAAGGTAGASGAPPAPKPAPGCVQNRLFVRSDLLDNFKFIERGEFSLCSRGHHKTHFCFGDGITHVFYVADMLINFDFDPQQLC